MAKKQVKEDKEAVEKEPSTKASSNSILKKINELYNGEDGLSKIGELVNEKVHAPRKKVTVMFIGNHSAGKSSFINWYIGDKVMPTGVAVESQGFTIVTQGKNKENSEIKGEGTLRYFPHIAGINTFGKSLLENLSTTVSPSNKHRFDVVDLIDTPGMVDGNVKYPFDVDGVLDFLAGHVDIICCFLDPIGQALCSRTMNVVQRLNINHHEKMRYYITKADTVDRVIDLIKVSQQVTQNLAQRVNNTHGFSVPPIFLPSEEVSSTKETDNSSLKSQLNEINQIGELLSGVDKAIKQKVQDNLKTLENNCSKITKLVQLDLNENQKSNTSRNYRNRFALLFIFLAFFSLSLLLFYYLEIIENLIGGEIVKMVPHAKAFHGHLIQMDNFVFYVASLSTIFLVLAKFFNWLANRYPVLSKNDVMIRTLYLDKLHEIKETRDLLFDQFYNETVPAEFSNKE